MASMERMGNGALCKANPRGPALHECAGRSYWAVALRPELIAILSVGVALLELGLRMSALLDDVGRWLARVASLLEGLGLSGRVTGTPSSGD